MVLNLKLKTAWWVVGYLRAVYFFAYVIGTEPDPDKVVSTLFKIGGFRIVGEKQDALE